MTFMQHGSRRVTGWRKAIDPVPRSFPSTRICAGRCCHRVRPRLSVGYRRAAHHVHKILRGMAASDLPVEQPDKFDLFVNLKAAKALGLPVPASVLLRAGEVIE
jgi:hypothetical protein